MLGTVRATNLFINNSISLIMYFLSSLATNLKVTSLFAVAEKYMIPIIADEVYEYAVSIN